MEQSKLQRNTKRKKHRVVGRGGKHAKTAGRGTKGQKSRSGRKMRPEIRDTIKKLPKLRGRGKNIFKRFREVVTPINLNVLSMVFANGESVTRATLVEKKVIVLRRGKTPRIKILSAGEIDKKIEVSGLEVSPSAKAKIEKAGGKVS
ncbi:MAG: uL15 family ribosomal protein [Candidatus Pacebacteria bacterium]|nr:uL15 family ribosomal protein [Candidatus Paceibacterota bacterium]